MCGSIFIRSIGFKCLINTINRKYCDKDAKKYLHLWCYKTQNKDNKKANYLIA